MNHPRFALVPIAAALLPRLAFAQAVPNDTPPAQSEQAAVEPTSSTPAPVPVSSDAAATGFGLTSLKLMRRKGLISAAEYESAIHDLTESVGVNAGEQPTVVLGKWATTLYGFVEADNIYDTTRSSNDLAGGAQVARPETQAGENPRFQMGVRSSRIGFRLKAPPLSTMNMSRPGSPPGTRC